MTIKEMEARLTELRKTNRKRQEAYNALYRLHITTDEDLEIELQAVLSKLHRRIGDMELNASDYANYIRQQKGLD